MSNEYECSKGRRGEKERRTEGGRVGEIRKEGGDG